MTLKTKTRYYLELLTCESIKLHGGTNNKTKKDKNQKNVPHIQITEVVLFHCNIANNV